jgi:predicted permease
MRQKLETFIQDVRYGGRMLRRSPSFAAIAILSIALGVGINAVVFGVLNALLFKPLPHVESPDRVVFVQPERASTMSFPNYRDLRDRNTTLEGLAATRIVVVGLSNSSGAERTWGYLVTGNYFDVLGVKPALGRFFRPEEDRVGGDSAYAVLSYALWQNRFGGDSGILDTTIRINAQPYRVVGIAPPGFRGTEIFYEPQFWVPMAMQPQVETYSWLDNRGTDNSMVYARLKSGVTHDQALEDLNRIAGDLARDYPRVNQGLKFKVTQPGLMGDLLRPGAEAFTQGIMLLAGLVLLAACVNLTSMLGSRATDRYREIAVRVSIGAGRGRVVRQLLTESLTLTALGGIAGAAFASWSLGVLSQWRPDFGFASQLDVAADARVWLFAAGVTLLSGVLSGMLPARIAWRADVQNALKGGGPEPGVKRRWTVRDALLSVQVALCCVLVMSTVVAAQGLHRALAARPGIQQSGVSVIAFDPGLARYSREDAQNLQRRALDAVQALPGVSTAAYANAVPLGIDQSQTTLYREETTEFLPKNSVGAAYYNVSPGYFAAIGTRLLTGREFEWRDDAEAQQVAIVNETLARRLTGDANAVGKRVRYGAQRSVEIVGVVEDGKYRQLTEDPMPAIFRPALQQYNSETVLLARTTRDESIVASEMARTFHSIDSSIPIYAMGSLTQYIGVAFFPAVAATVALSAFGVLAAMLAITGIYGLARYNVSRREREIGIRLSVGARAVDILSVVLGRTTVFVAIGAAAGIALGNAASRVLASIVYQASSQDPVTILIVTITMSAIACAAALGPVRRAISIDPARALRQE